MPVLTSPSGKMYNVDDDKLESVLAEYEMSADEVESFLMANGGVEEVSEEDIPDDIRQSIVECGDDVAGYVSWGGWSGSQKGWGVCGTLETKKRDRTGCVGYRKYTTRCGRETHKFFWGE